MDTLEFEAALDDLIYGYRTRGLTLTQMSCCLEMKVMALDEEAAEEQEEEEGDD